MNKRKPRLEWRVVGGDAVIISGDISLTYRVESSNLSNVIGIIPHL